MSNYAKLTNPKWKDYRPALPAGVPEDDALLLDMLENLLVKGKIEISRTFLPGRYPWQIAYEVNNSLPGGKGYMMAGGGASVRDALAALAISMAEGRLLKQHR